MKSKKFLSTLRNVLNVIVIAAWFSYLAAQVASSVFAGGAKYLAGESFESSATEEEYLMDSGAGTDGEGEAPLLGD